MTIIFYSHTGKLGNGGAESLLSIVLWFALKYKCVVITPDEGALNSELTKNNIQNIVLPYYWSSNSNNLFNSRSFWGKIGLIRIWILRFLSNRKLVFQHSKFVRTINPDFIYSNTSVINMGLLVSQNLNKHHVWHLREFQLLDYELLPDFGWWYFQKKLNESDIVISNSYALKNFYGNFIPENKIKIVYNGISIEEDITDKTPNAQYKFLMVGSLIDYKGHKSAIIAANQLSHKGYKFIIDIVGIGQLQNELEILIEKLELGYVVKLHGESSDVSSFYRKADCYLMCSRLESFGRVTVEAMLHKLPVIGRVSTFSATGEIIRDSIDGLTYNETPELEKKMEYMINNKSEGVKMGLAGYERAREKFTMEKSMLAIEEIILGI